MITVEPGSTWSVTKACSDFADAYGVRMTDGPLAELCARAVVVIEADGTVAYTQLVPSIGEEPDYDAALAAL